MSGELGEWNGGGEWKSSSEEGGGGIMIDRGDKMNWKVSEVGISGNGKC